MSPSRLIGLLDCNSFFVSCEKLFRPDLKDKAVVVLSNNDGVVVSRSIEAKKLGVPMGEPYYKIKHIAERGLVIVFSSNYRLYGDMSNRVMKTLQQWTPHIEVYSIDEAFLNLTQCNSVSVNTAFKMFGLGFGEDRLLRNIISSINGKLTRQNISLKLSFTDWIVKFTGNSDMIEKSMTSSSSQ